MTSRLLLLLLAIAHGKYIGNLGPPLFNLILIPIILNKFLTKLLTSDLRRLFVSIERNDCLSSLRCKLTAFGSPFSNSFSLDVNVRIT